MGLNLGMLGGNTEAKKHLTSLGLSGQPLVLGASAVATQAAEYSDRPMRSGRRLPYTSDAGPMTSCIIENDAEYAVIVTSTSVVLVSRLLSMDGSDGM